MMPTRWPSYILILLTAVLGLLIPILLPQIWRLGRKRSDQKRANDATGREAHPRLSTPIAIRFHLAALLFVGFVGFAFLMIPLLFNIRSERGNFSALTLIGIALPMLIALFYALQKGDLSWSTPRSKDEETQ